MAFLTGLILATIGSAVAGSIISAVNNQKNIDMQKETNEQNIEMQNQVNAQNQYNMEHAHQIEMKDLEAAGLNPVLTANGGNGAALAQLSSPKAVAPQSDLSGVSSAISGAINSLTMLTMATNQQDLMRQRNSLLQENELLRQSGKDKRLLQALEARAKNNYGVNSPVEKALRKVKVDRPISDEEWFSIFD